MKPKRILFIITELNSGGAETMLLRLVTTLDRMKFELHVLGLSVNGPIGEEIARSGIPVVTLGLRGVWSNPIRALQMLRIIRLIKPDLVHTWMYHSNLLGGVLSKLGGVRPVIWGIHHTNLDPTLNKRTTLWISRLCGFLSCRVPTKIISCSKVAQVAHVDAGYCKDKFIVVPNGVDTSLFRPDAGARKAIRKELGIPPSAHVVGMIARWDPQKDHGMFFRAAARIMPVVSDVHFVLAGGHGIDLSNRELNRQIREAAAESSDFSTRQHLVDRIHLLGQRFDIQAIMASLDVLASSSLGEAFSNVIAEAMSAGVPAVVTDVGDSAMIVGGIGRVVPPGDDRAFANALRDILTLGSEGYDHAAKASRNRIVDNFDLQAVVRAHETIYLDALTSYGG